MDYTIGAYDPATRTVPVMFSTPGKSYPRNVSADLSPSGNYDAERTEAIVQHMLGEMQTLVSTGALRSDEELEELNQSLQEPVTEE